MNSSANLKVRIAPFCLLLAAACTGTDELALSPASSPGAAQEGTRGLASGQVESVAEALLIAAQAERAQDGAALARAALQLERLGATPQTDGDVAAMKRWRASLPADAAPMRGRALGPAYRSAALDPGGTTQLNQTFLGGRSAQIVLRVSRGPVPRLVVRDQSGRQVCAVGDDPVKCRWVPLYTQRHRIEIVNSGPELSEFFIVFD